MRTVQLSSVIGVLAAASIACGSVTVDYNVDAGGENPNPLNGLSARATWEITGNTLTILVENTSTGVPQGFDLSDSLLVTLGFNLPSGLDIATGDSAVIGPGSNGVGSWSARNAGDSVHEEWAWTNDYGGDLMNFGESLATRQIISTSEGQDGGSIWLFQTNQEDPSIDGPSGGIASDPPQISPNPNQPAVSDSIFYTLTLTGTLTEEQLAEVANGGVVEYGSDQKYLVPEPGSIALVILGTLIAGRMRRATR